MALVYKRPKRRKEGKGESSYKRKRDKFIRVTEPGVKLNGGCTRVRDIPPKTRMGLIKEEEKKKIKKKKKETQQK